MFERFDDVPVPEQWDDITNRAAGPGGPSFERGGGHRIAILVAAAAVVVGLAGVLWVGLDDGDDLSTVDTPADTIPASTIPVATAPPTTAPPATVEPTHPPASTTPETAPPTTAPVTSVSATTAPAGQQAFECTEIAGDPDGEHVADPRLDQFGPLGSAPALDIFTNLPEMLNEGYEVVRVASGTAILLQTHYDEQPGWSVTIVNDDGKIRWRRCDFASEAIYLLATDRALVVAEQDPADTSPIRATAWRMLDPSTGSDTGFLPIPSDLIAYPFAFEPFVLFSNFSGYVDPSAPEIVEPTDVMYVLDTMTTEVVQAAYPPAYYGQPIASLHIELVEAPNSAVGWVLIERGDQYPSVASVYADGSWTSDPEVIRSLVPTSVFAPDFGPWRGFDPLGNEVWALPQYGVLHDEGPIWRDDRDVSLLGVCTASLGAHCTDAPGLIGVDRSSGSVLWQLSGPRQIAAVGDGYAIIGDGNGNFDPSGVPPGWIMIDTTTGQTVAGGEWPDYETFNMGGSMEEDGQWVRREGGVLLAVNGQHIRVWMPAAASNGTIDVSLAS